MKLPTGSAEPGAHPKNARVVELEFPGLTGGQPLAGRGVEKFEGRNWAATLPPHCLAHLALLEVAMSPSRSRQSTLTAVFELEREMALALTVEISSCTQSEVKTEVQVPSSDSAFLLPAEATSVNAITQPVYSRFAPSVRFCKGLESVSRLL